MPDATGRQAPQVIEGSQFTLEADMVIKALGFDPEDLPRLFDTEGLEVTRWGTVLTDFKTKMTSLDGVFADGDIVRGASLVVWAIRDGRDAAEQMHSDIQAKTATAAEAAEAAGRGRQGGCRNSDPLAPAQHGATPDRKSAAEGKRVT